MVDTAPELAVVCVGRQQQRQPVGSASDGRSFAAAYDIDSGPCESTKCRSRPLSCEGRAQLSRPPVETTDPIWARCVTRPSWCPG